jgi:hypothetical protein
VSPLVIRVMAMPDYLDLADFDEVFRTVLDWNGWSSASTLWFPETRICLI